MDDDNSIDLTIEIQFFKNTVMLYITLIALFIVGVVWVLSMFAEPKVAPNQQIQKIKTENFEPRGF